MPRVDFFTLLPDASADAVDLLGHMLALDPDDRLINLCLGSAEYSGARISVTEALEHAYVRDCRDPEGEPVADHQVGIDAEEEAATSLDDWRELIWKEIQTFRMCSRRLSYSSGDDKCSVELEEQSSFSVNEDSDVDDVEEEGNF
ncbi:unnamed protein product [Haemonchus placei]|uniref:Protein kinase domain-containing protein n=1 Tax=Haemonchus placei TaxID=6290 RepID=A0A0N4VTM4_HAEPC|nr:unnamed protein product [Haemonchus placei]